MSQLAFEANESGGEAKVLPAISQLPPRLFSRIFLEPYLQKLFLFIFVWGWG